jgi:agmatine deiminase
MSADGRSASTPRELGFRMPAEWEPHEATWLAWPHQKEDWPGRFAPIAWVYADIVRRLARRERVRILISDAAQETRTRRMLRWLGVDEAAVEFFPAPLDRTWVRDFGPIFVKASAGEVALTNWRFNGWAKYANWQHDDAVPDFLAERLGLRQWQPVVDGHRVVLEGGSIDVNGQGALLTTEECLLSPIQARNPELNREQIEQVLCDYLGVRKILWLRNGIAGDDTHGHVDDLARFVSPNVVVVASEEDRSDVNYEPLLENRRLLESMTDQDGRPLQVVPLPMPEPVIFKGQRLPASYANFYIANGVVLVPTFNDPRDRIALNILSELFPDREVTGIYCGDLVWGLGTLHCMSQQQPA